MRYDVFMKMSQEFLLDLLKATISLFIVVDPFGNIPIFVGLTSDMDSERRARAFRMAVITGFILLMIFAIAGRWVLKIFNITLYSFRIAGGILLLFLALELLMREKVYTKISPEESGAVPLGVPLLVGPGAITATIINLESVGFSATVISVAIVCIITWIVLKFIEPIHRLLGKVGSTVVSKVMAMLLAAIAVQFILEGISEYLSEIV